MLERVTIFNSKAMEQVPFQTIISTDLKKFFTVLQGEICVYQEFLNLYGLSPSVLKVRRSQYKKGNSKNYAFLPKVDDQGNNTFVYKFLTIPEKTRNAHAMPEVSQVASLFSNLIKKKYSKSESELDSSFKNIKMEMLNGLIHYYKFCAFFYALNLHEVSVAKMARRVAVLMVLKTYKNELKNGVIGKLFKATREPEFKDLEFPKNLKTFYGYLQRAIEADDLVTFVKGRFLVPSNAKKTNKDVINLVCYAAGHSNKVSAKRVMIWVNTVLLAFPKINGGRIIHITRIEKIINENKQRIKIFQEGEDHVRKVIAPYFHIIQAENPFDQFQMDEWHVEFAAKRNNKRVRLIMFTIMDACTRKLIHWGFTTEYNSDFVKKLLYEAVLLCRGRFPAEIVCDFSSVNTADSIRVILEYVQRKFPEKFTWTLSSNPNRKGILERFFNTFGTVYLSPVVGYTGRGITAVRENSSPAKYMEIILNNKDYLNDEKELIRILNSFLEQYNRNGIHPNDASPNRKFEDLRPQNAIQLESYHIAHMFYNLETRTMSNNQVQVKTDMTRFYQTFDSTLFSFNNKEVDCRINERAPDVAYVFKKGSDEFLGTFSVESKFHTAKVNQTREDLEVKKSLFEKREKLVAELLNDKIKTAQSLKELTGGTSVSEFLNTIENMLYRRSSDVSQATGQPSSSPKKINGFDVPSPKRKSKSRDKKGREKANSLNKARLITDTFQRKTT